MLHKQPLPCLSEACSVHPSISMPAHVPASPWCAALCYNSTWQYNLYDQQHHRWWGLHPAHLPFLKQHLDCSSGISCRSTLLILHGGAGGAVLLQAGGTYLPASPTRTYSADVWQAVTTEPGTFLSPLGPC